MIEPITKQDALMRLRNDTLMEMTINEINVSAITKEQISGVVNPQVSEQLAAQLHSFQQIVGNLKKRMEIIDGMLMEEGKKHGKN